MMGVVLRGGCLVVWSAVVCCGLLWYTFVWSCVRVCMRVPLRVREGL
jgi:hypothetical protein